MESGPVQEAPVSESVHPAPAPKKDLKTVKRSIKELHWLDILSSPPTPPVPTQILELPPEGALLSEEMRLPADVRTAILQGFIDSDTMVRLEQILNSAFWGDVVRASPGLRQRILADPNFLFKLAADQGVGFAAKILAEYSKRGPAFVQQLDAVFTNVVMGIVTEFLFTYTRAPTLNIRALLPSERQKLSLVEQLPQNMFEADRGSQRYSPAQRAATFFYKALQFAAVGLVSGLIGTAVSKALLHMREGAPTLGAPAAVAVSVRGVSVGATHVERSTEDVASPAARDSLPLLALTRTDPSLESSPPPPHGVELEAQGVGARGVPVGKAKEQPRGPVVQLPAERGVASALQSSALSQQASAVQPWTSSVAGPSEDIPRTPPVVKNSLAYALFLATSSNARYQAINGMDRVLYEVLFPNVGSQDWAKIISVVVRFGNAFWGSRQWITFQRLLKLT